MTRRLWTWLQQPLFPDDGLDRAPRWFYLALAVVAALAGLAGPGDLNWLGPDLFEALGDAARCGAGMECL